MVFDFFRGLLDDFRQDAKQAARGKMLTDPKHPLYTPFAAYDAYPLQDAKGKAVLEDWLKGGVDEIAHNGNWDLGQYVLEQMNHPGRQTDRNSGDYEDIYFFAGFLSAYRNVKHRIVAPLRSGDMDAGRGAKERFSKMPIVSREKIMTSLREGVFTNDPETLLYRGRDDPGYRTLMRFSPQNNLAVHLITDPKDQQQLAAFDGMMLAYRLLGVIDYIRPGR
jgi:hypothetical protein